MSSSPHGPPPLDADDIVRFAGARQFLDEYQQNLRVGRLFVRTKRMLAHQARIELTIEVPGVDWHVRANATVLLAKNGYVGLQLQDLEGDVGPALELLAEEARAQIEGKEKPPVADEITQIGSRPELTDDLDGDVANEGTSVDPRPLASAPMPPARGRTIPDVKTTPGLGSRGGPAALSPPPLLSDVEELAAVPTHGDAQAALHTPDEPEGDPLESAELKLPRATTSGIVKVADLGDLLGLYLSSLRHGFVTLYGGPRGEPGDEVTIKIAAKRVVSLDASVLARNGEWVTLSIKDPQEITTLLREQSEEWRPVINALTPRSASFAPPPPPSPPPRAKESPAIPPAFTPAPFEVPKSVSIAPQAMAHEPTLQPKSGSITPQAIAQRPTLTLRSEDGMPAEPPKLEGDSLMFRSARDLQQEIDTNLRSGGLFAQSAPLPIRSHKTLRVFVTGTDTGVRIEADVVFAAAGRVGFAVGSFSDALKALDKWMKQGASLPSEQPPPAPASGPPPPASYPAPSASSPAPPASIPPPDERRSIPPQFSGRLDRPAGKIELLEPEKRRIEGQEHLDHASAVYLFEYVSRNKMRGVLTLRRKEEVRTLYFHEGSVAFVDARPVIEEHCLGRILVLAKKVNEASLKEAIEKARASRTPLGRVLVSMGKISAAGLVAALREQTRLKVEAAFEWSSGTYEWAPWQEPPSKADLVVTSGLGILAKYCRALFEHTTTAEIEDLLQPCMARVLTRTPGMDVQSPVLGLQPKEIRFIEITVDGKRTISESITGSPLGRLASLRIIAFGVAVGFLRYKEGGRPAQPREVRPATDGRGFGSVQRTLEEEVKLMKSQNYFDVIGVHWSAHYRSFAAAYQKLRTRYDLTRAELKDAPPNVLKLAKEALDIIEAAYRTLSHEETRIAYRKRLFDQTEREYSADMLVKQGEVLLLRGDRIGSIEALETAVELSPTARNRQLLANAREGRSGN
jgi:hypothetical protein